MKTKIITIILFLSSLFSFADFGQLNHNHGNKEDLSIFIFNALFANTENPYPIELWENRDDDQMNIFDIAREIKSVANLKDKIFDSTKGSDQEIILQRLSQMEDIADRALIMEADKWKPHYVNELMKHIIGIRHAGISDLIPNVVDPANCKKKEDHEDQQVSAGPYNYFYTPVAKSILNPCDENGENWTSLARLAEPNDEGTSIADYMQMNGTNIQLIKTWWGSQLLDSWFPGCRAVKAFYSNQRTVDVESYYWTRDGYQAAKDEYSAFWQKGASADTEMCYPTTTDQENVYVNAFTIWHAYVQEVLAKTRFYHNNPDNKELCVIRTNGANALKTNNITSFGKNYIIPSAAYDSFSLINIFAKGGSEKVITESLVPHHRVIHLYPLLVAETPDGTKKHIKKDMSKDVDWLINNHYNENGLLTIDRTNPSSVERLVEDLVYYKYNESTRTPFNEYGFVGWSMMYLNPQNYKDMEKIVVKILTVLPDQLPSENAVETLVNIIVQFLGQDVENNEFFSETEVVVLSGPDLPFDYFYNTDDNLSGLEKRLGNGEGACGYWPDLKELKHIGDLGGSTGARLYQNPKTAKKYVLKKGASPGHIREEALADRFYEAMGHTIPESRLYEASEGPVKVATYLENSKSLREAYNNADETEKKRLRSEISKGFIIDALLVNFDVVGLAKDNILVGEDGQVYRVDNGASFRYRAMGKLKNDAPDPSRKSWNPSPIALWTLRDPTKNSNCAEIFADVDIYEIAEKTNDLIPKICASEYNKDVNGWISCFGILSQHHVFDKNRKLREQTDVRFNNFKKVADKALEMQIRGLTAQEADIELRKWVESEDWGPAFE